MTHSILIYCRSGFENEAATEIMEKAKIQEIAGYVKAKTNNAYILFYPHNPNHALDLWRTLNIHNLIFARQILLCFSYLTKLPEENRILPIINECEIIETIIGKEKIPTLNKLFVEVPDTNEHKELLNFCKKFSTPLQIKLERMEILRRKCEHPLYNLHLFFLEGTTCYLALSNIKNASPHFMGIPRLKFPQDAPSRSALKLEEAFLFFLTDTERTNLLKNGMQAVDLGASPGGWTYQFVTRSILVTAIDNAKMDPKLMESGLVTHCKEDGFRFTPKKPVQWMVCDMVEKPLRIAKLVLHWAQQNFAQNFIFNLKLPMKKRLEEVNICLNLIKDELDNREGHYIIECKQLYHDREEVTVWLRLI